MGLPKLYLETTIPSYLVARPSRFIHVAARHETTRRWWETRRRFYEMFVSDIVLQEARAGDPEMAAAREAALAGLPQLEQSPEADALAQRLLDMEIIPVKAAGDAAHVALAAVHGMDFLLTWNCKHINNATLKRRIEAACAALGFRCPVICTPNELR
jgi:hypothetical protein